MKNKNYYFISPSVSVSQKSRRGLVGWVALCSGWGLSQLQSEMTAAGTVGWGLVASHLSFHVPQRLSMRLLSVG